MGGCGNETWDLWGPTHQAVRVSAQGAGWACSCCSSCQPSTVCPGTFCFVTGEHGVPQQSQYRLSSFGMPARQKPARTQPKPPVCGSGPVQPVLWPGRGRHCFCACVGGLWTNVRDVALLGVTLGCSLAVCFGPCITSTAILSGVCLGKAERGRDTRRWSC